MPAIVTPTRTYHVEGHVRRGADQEAAQRIDLERQRVDLRQRLQPAGHHLTG
jgi:hypothetical protein